MPSWYLQCTDDQMIHPPALGFMAERMGATMRSVAASHAVFMTHPNEVADIIGLAAASATYRQRHSSAMKENRVTGHLSMLESLDAVARLIADFAHNLNISAR